MKQKPRCCILVPSLCKRSFTFQSTTAVYRLVTRLGGSRRPLGRRGTTSSYSTAAGWRNWFVWCLELLLYADDRWRPNHTVARMSCWQAAICDCIFSATQLH